MKICDKCSKLIEDDVNFCPFCGNAIKPNNTCCKCGKEIINNNNFCPNCGYHVQNINCDNDIEENHNNNSTDVPKSKKVAGLLAIFLGMWGVHNFYLGKTKEAVLELGLWLLGFFLAQLFMIIAVIMGIAEGIMILTGKIDTDGNGNKLI